MKEILARLEEAKQSGEHIRATCPFCSRRRTFRWNESTGWFICFKCKTRGNVRMLMGQLHFSPKAIDIASERFARRVQTYRFKPSTRVAESYSTLPEYLLEMYKTERSVLPHIFNQSIQKDFQIGFDKTLGRIVFPVRDLMGNLVAISGRATMQWQVPRYHIYKFPSIPNYVSQNRQHLYLFDKVYPEHFFSPSNKGLTVIVEGYKAALWVLQNGYDVVGAQGPTLTIHQTRLISKIGGEKVILLDNELGAHLPKNDGTWYSSDMFMRLMRNRNTVSVAKYPKGSLGKSPDDLTPDELNWAIKNRAHTLIPQKWERTMRK